MSGPASAGRIAVMLIIVAILAANAFFAIRRAVTATQTDDDDPDAQLERIRTAQEP